VLNYVPGSVSNRFIFGLDSGLWPNEDSPDIGPNRGNRERNLPPNEREPIKEGSSHGGDALNEQLARYCVSLVPPIIGIFSYSPFYELSCLL